MLPFIELRGGIPVAAMSGIPFVVAIIVCFIGNIIPVPFILLLIKKVFAFLKRYEKSRKVVEWCEKRAHGKSESVRKKQMLGLFLFVAIPLPGTGAWMGSLISALMDLPRMKSFLTITAGVLCAGAIMSVLFYLFPDIFAKLFFSTLAE